MLLSVSSFVRVGLAASMLVLFGACSDSKTVSSKDSAAAAAAAAADTNQTATVAIADKEWMRCSLGQTWTGNACAGKVKELNFEEAQTAAAALNDQGFEGKKDWRVPTIRELASLVFCSQGFYDDGTDRAVDVADGGKPVPGICAGGSDAPKLYTQLFPTTLEDSSYWSSSFGKTVSNDGVAAAANAAAGINENSSGNFAWGVYFGSGDVRYYGRKVSLSVRLVRTVNN